MLGTGQVVTIYRQLAHRPAKRRRRPDMLYYDIKHVQRMYEATSWKETQQRIITCSCALRSSRYNLRKGGINVMDRIDLSILLINEAKERLDPDHAESAPSSLPLRVIYASYG